MTGRAAGGGTHAAQFSRWGLGRRSIPAKQPVMKPTWPSSPGGGSAGDPSPSRLNRVAARRSSLRFGRNTPGIPPSRALSAGRLAGLGAHVGSTTGCSPHRWRRSSLRFGRNTHPAPCQPGASPPPRSRGSVHHVAAPLIVAFRSKYTRYSSLTRLVSRAPHRPRRSPGFHHRPLANRHVAGCRWRTGPEVAIIRRPACGAEVFHR